MGGAASLGGVANGDTRDRYFCHQCHHLFNLGPGNGLQCPLCDSMFIEEMGPGGRGGPADMFSSRQGHLLTSDQSRRIVNATALLRLLEAQLRDELEFLQRTSAQGQAPTKKQMTHTMRFKCRSINVNMDQICSQPSCPICTVDFEVDKEATRLPCSHLFHQGCVMPWLEMKLNCPICRAEISPEVLELEEYEKYSCKELLERLDILEVEVADAENKSSVDLAFILHKHLKQLETDEKSRERELEVQRQAEEQQRRATFERIMNGGETEDHIHTSTSLRREPRFHHGDSGRMIMLDGRSLSGGGMGGSVGGGGGGGLMFGTMRPIPMMSEFYSNRRLQQRLEEDRPVRVRSDVLDFNMPHSSGHYYGHNLIPRSDSEEEELVGGPPSGAPRVRSRRIWSHDEGDEVGGEDVSTGDGPLGAFLSSTRQLRREGRAVREEAEGIARSAATAGNGTNALAGSSSSSNERLQEIERIEREMEERQRRESEQADREDLAELNEWEASQGLPLTRSFRTSTSPDRAMQGYAQSFIARVADSALSARVSSMTALNNSNPSEIPMNSASTRSGLSIRGEWEPDRESLSVRDAITSLRWEVNATVVDSDSD